MLQVRELAIDVAARRVLADASFTVNAGDKVGLVGRNGAGKTSLLKVLSGENDSSAGVVLRRGTLGYVPQNPRPRSEAAGAVHDARRGVGGAAQHLQQAGLAGAVAADEADLVAGADREAGTLEHEGAADLDGELTDLQHPAMVVAGRFA